MLRIVVPLALLGAKTESKKPPKTLTQKWWLEGGKTMHIDKAKSAQVVGLILHDERRCDNHSNESIDPNKKHLNYNLCEGEALDNYNKRMSEVYMRKNKQGNALAMFSTTLPKEVPLKRREEFFKLVYQFYCNKFGEKNVISSWVHGDETTWHSHTKVIPVYYDSNKKRETVSFDRVVNHSVYKNAHRELQTFLEKEMKIPVPILNGATAGGNKSILELKVDSLKQECQDLEEKLDYQENMIANQSWLIDRYKEEIDYLKQKDSINKQYDEITKELPELISTVEELQSFKETKACSMATYFFENVHEAVSEFIDEGEEPDELVVPVSTLSVLENTLSPFLKLNELLIHILQTFKSLQGQIDNANNIRSQKAQNEPIRRNERRSRGISR